MLKTYTLSGKMQGERKKNCKLLASSGKINILVKIQPLPEVLLFYCWVWLFFGVSLATVFSLWQPWLSRVLQPIGRLMIIGVARGACPSQISSISCCFVLWEAASQTKYWYSAMLA